jgi:putative PIN family toxin of toxin-antitoxin system
VAAVLANKGIAAQVFASVAQGEVYNFYTSEMLEELRGVLERPKFELEKEKQEKFMHLFQEISLLIQQQISCLVVQCRDPKDDKFLSLAKQIDADFIITLDADLLALGSINKTDIIMPGEFLERMKTNRRV